MYLAPTRSVDHSSVVARWFCSGWRTRESHVWHTACVVMLVGGLLLLPQFSLAACNLIPQTTKSFQGTLGVADRPYAIPGEWVSLRLDPVCHGSSAGFGPMAADHVVTLVFSPPAGPTNIVVLASDCAAMEPQRLACGNRTDVDTASCLTVNTASPPLGLNVIDKDGTRYLRFRFPDTDELVGTPIDDRTLTGAMTIAVTTTSETLPCDLASASCADTPGLRACIDELFESDGSCGAVPHSVFPRFTALPLPNDYQAVCTTPSPPCTGLATEVRLVTDADGNLLIPMDWRGILVRKNDVPVPRLLRAASSLEAFAGLSGPISLPSGEFVDSYTVEGGLLPPVFDRRLIPLRRLNWYCLVRLMRRKPFCA